MYIEKINHTYYITDIKTRGEIQRTPLTSIFDLSALLPSGFISVSARNDVPSGWLVCDGTIYNIRDYPALFAVIGNTYGGDGITTFAVPNLKQKAVLGQDTTDVNYDELGELVP